MLFLTPTETEYVKYLREKADIPKVKEIPLLSVLTDGLLPGALRYLEGGKKEKAAAIKMEDAATCVQLKMENVVALSATSTETEKDEDNDEQTEEDESSSNKKTSNVSLANRSKA